MRFYNFPYKGIIYTWWAILAGLLITPGSLWSGPHDKCAMCHGNRLGIGIAVFTKQRKIPIVNPNTGKPLERIESICLNCHGDEEYKAQLKELGADISFLEDEPEAKPEGTLTPLDEIMLEPMDVGFRIIDLHQTHPVGIVPNPQKVVLPAEAKGFKWQEDQLTCLGCHDHHPSNPNYKYLRWPTNKGKNMISFCAHCHPEKVKSKGIDRQHRRKRRIVPISGE